MIACPDEPLFLYILVGGAAKRGPEQSCEMVGAEVHPAGHFRQCERLVQFRMNLLL